MVIDVDAQNTGTGVHGVFFFRFECPERVYGLLPREVSSVERHEMT